MTKLEFMQNNLSHRTSFDFGAPTMLKGQSLGRKITLHLGEEGSDGIECGVSGGTPTLTAYLVYGHYMGADKEITLRVTDNDGNTYSTKITSNRIEANHFYKGTFRLKQDVSQ